MLYDRAGKGSVPTSQLGDLMRSCGTNPSNAELKQLMAGLGASFTWDSFKNIVEKKVQAMNPKGFEQDMIAAFKAWDDVGSSTGSISVADFRHIMKSVGEPLNNDEMNKLIAIADPDRTGQIRYADFAKELNPFRGL